MLEEGIGLEFKRKWNDSAKKAVVAFANTEGGELLVGVEDDGQPCGVDNFDESIVQIVNALNDGVKPDLGLFLKVAPRDIDGVKVVSVDVSRGSDRPYYLSDKGLRPSGVYVRRGASSVPASDAEIRSMIKESSGDSFEESRAIVQNLTFEEAERAFSECGVAWGAPYMKTLGLVSDDGLFTNLGWLLSDQCTTEIKIAVFEGDTKLEFKTRREFSGSLFKQFREVSEFLDLNNGLKATIVDGYRRVDMRDYPQLALREALLNSIVHREYSFTGPALVSIFASKIEIVNLGGLPKGLTKNDAMLGVSMQRNPRLAQIFYRLGFIEAYGTGIPKIMESYADSGLVPAFEVSDNAFKVVLPSCNVGRVANAEEARAIVNEEREPRAGHTSAEEAAIELGSRANGFTRAEFQRKLGVSQSTAIGYLRQLIQDDIVKGVGGGRSTHYVLRPERESSFKQSKAVR